MGNPDPDSVAGGPGNGGPSWFSYKTNGFLNIVGGQIYKTNGFLTFLNENAVKPMVF